MATTAIAKQRRTRATDTSAPRRRLETTSWFAVARAYAECERRFTRMLQEIGLTTTQFDVLAAIHSLGEQALPKAIAEQLVVTRANVTGVVQRLESHGLIQTRRRDSDARSIVCSLTEPGRQRLQQAEEANRRFIRAQCEPFAAAELAATEDLMRRMHAHLQTLDPRVLAKSDQERPTNKPRKIRKAQKSR